MVPSDPTPSPPGTALYAVSSRNLDQIVIDAQGYVLYRSERDSADPSRSVCDPVCARSWLPVPCQGEIRVEGIDRQLVACFDRLDGSRQLSLAGWPLYGYAGDRMPGDINGHGLADEWYAISPSGTPAG
ncbi:hypothetical protein O7632_05410 [Solwaraspora sp. WMMD406]|uniref:hypothetical protein n=1 Tax=Solwaraspora sp. WMMD406 TaxID=3016095 RepID=UPI0024172AC9|nr:hypothetical protein [Solwaraspora sp. WMMD406]MDG4763549.1 hypothetical protein [Solwaraspora sp. WMMD406]